MSKLSTVLTMTLLLGSSLQASALQIADGTLTPRSAANAWIAEKASGKTPATPAYRVHETLSKAADAAKAAGNPERILELWKTQQAITKESGVTPSSSFGNFSMITASAVHETLSKAADAAKAAGNPERILELWKTQQTITKESGVTPSISFGNFSTIPASTVHETLSKAADAAKAAGNPERMLEQWKTQQAFTKESGVTPNIMEGIYPKPIHDAFSLELEKETDIQRIVRLYESWIEFEATNRIDIYSSIKRPSTFTPKYDAAKKEVEKTRSLVPADKRFETGATTADELSVKALVGLYGTMMLDTSSHSRFVESFQSLYRTAALRLHPDKSKEDAEKFKTLGAHKAWVEALMPQTFAASAK